MKRFLMVLITALAVATLVTSCAQPQTVVVKETVEVEKVVTQVIKEMVKETVVVEGTPKVIEREVTKVVTPTPLPPPTEAPLAIESPMLAERVQKGELPPLEERLPQNPLVVADGVLAFEGAIPDLSLGQYGGTLRTQHIAGGGLNGEVFYLTEEPVVCGPDIFLEDLYGNVFESVAVSPDNKKFTFALRKGLKWSDGVLVTMEDVAFTVEDMYYNEEYQAIPPSGLVSPGEAQTPAVFQVVDDWTFSLTFATPNGAFLRDLVTGGKFGAWPSYEVLMNPKHYLQQWHPKYAEADALAAELQQAGLEAAEWPQLFGQKFCNHWDRGRLVEKCIDYPMLSPFILTEVTVEGATLERNPYYFKVDWEGRQLPYIDKVTSVANSDWQAAALLAMNGQLDLYWNVDLLQAALYMQKGQELGYEVIMNLESHSDGNSFYINGCTSDPVVRGLFNDIRFRKAMNYAMNRQEMNDKIYLGFASLPTRIMESEHSPEKANALLDEIGMTERDANGYRLSPDGEEVKLLIEYSPTSQTFGTAPAAELFAEHLKEVGINAELRATESALLNERGAAHDIQIYVWITNTPTNDIGRETRRPSLLQWCPEWNWWEGKQEEGKVVPKPDDMPDEFVDYVQAIEDRAEYVPQAPEDAALYEVIKAFQRDQYWVLINVTDIPTPRVVNNRLGNIMRTGSGSGMWKALEITYFK